jgi:hypothetical protein
MQQWLCDKDKIFIKITTYQTQRRGVIVYGGGQDLTHLPSASSLSEGEGRTNEQEMSICKEKYYELQHKIIQNPSTVLVLI